MGNSESKEYQRVVIEIGSVNSGYAYCLGGKTPKIFTATYDYGLPEDRVPTALLLNSNGAIDSFGTVAKDKFYALALKDKQHEYKYFDKIQIEPADATNEDSVPSQEIYAKIVKYLYEKCSNIFKSDINFKPSLVLTVSGKNDETVSKCMRFAASTCVIDEKNIIILHEIQAAALYCTHQLLVAKRYAGIKKLTKGCRFIVVNLGGNKTQYCTFEAKEKEQVKQLSDIECLPFGGETVTESFMYKIELMVGKEKWDSFKDTCRYSYVDIKRSFENCKRTFDSSTQGSIIELPLDFMKMVDSEKLQQSCKGISFFEDNKIIIERETLISVFDESLQEIANKLKTSDSKETDIILLVGGFAKSSYAREFITNEMKTNPVVLVPDPDLAVLKGAAMLDGSCLRSFISENPSVQGKPQEGNNSLDKSLLFMMY